MRKTAQATVAPGSKPRVIKTKVATRAAAPAAPGYSGKPLLLKLGMKPGARFRLVAAPDGYERVLGPLPDGARPVPAGRGRCDVVQLFTARRAELERELPRLRECLEPDGMIWVSWPKKSSGVATDISEGDVREVALGSGLVDVKVCAVTDVWSGLKLVIPVKDRPAAR